MLTKLHEDTAMARFIYFGIGGSGRIWKQETKIQNVSATNPQLFCKWKNQEAGSSGKTYGCHTLVGRHAALPAPFSCPDASICGHSKPEMELSQVKTGVLKKNMQPSKKFWFFTPEQLPYHNRVQTGSHAQSNGTKIDLI